MQKYFYPIFKLPDFYIRDYQKQELPLWVKWWLLGKAGRKLSEILTGSEFTLLNTVSRKFKIFELSGRTEQDTSKIVYICDGTETGDYYFTHNNINYQFTMPTVLSGDILVFNTTTLVLSLDNTAITTETGTTGTELTFLRIPIPNYIETFKNVTGNANVKIQNKNFFDGELELGSYNERDGLKIPGGNVNYRNKNIISVKPSQTYTFSIDGVSQKYCIYFYDRNGDYISANLSLSTGTFTNLSNAYFINFRCFGADFTSSYATLKVQFEEGSTATSYVPHSEQNYPFTFSEGQRAMQGTQLLDDGIHNIRKQKILDGTENWVLYQSNTHIFNLPVGNIKASLCKCSHFRGITQGISSIDYCCLTNNYGIYINNKDVSGLDEWKAYLAQQYANNTPVVVEYLLADSALEDNIIPYNETQQAQYNAMKQAKTYKDVTYITTESDELAPELKIQYWKERGSEE